MRAAHAAHVIPTRGMESRVAVASGAAFESAIFASARMSVHQIQNLLIRALRLQPIARTKRIRHAVLEMIPHDELAYRPQSFVHGRKLGQDVGTVAALLHHPVHPADLTLDLLQSLEGVGLEFGVDTAGVCVVSHIHSIPPYGMIVRSIKRLSGGESTATGRSAQLQ